MHGWHKGQEELESRVFVTVENEQIHLMHAHNKFMFNSNYGYTNSIIIGTDNYIPFKR